MTALDPFPEGACEICGRFPAEPVHARKFTGNGLAGRTIFWKGLACRDCAVAQYREGLTHCLAAGWWGLGAPFVNPVRIAQNAAGLRRSHGIDPPSTEAIEPPLDPGEPVLRRPQAWLGIVVAVLLVALLAWLVGSVTSGDEDAGLATGDCVILPTGDAAVAVTPVSCTTSHDAEVTGRRDGDGVAEGAALCENEAVDYVGPSRAAEVRAVALRRLSDGDSAGVVCLVASADGERSDESFQRAARPSEG